MSETDLLHPKEEERLNALYALDILDTPPEESYDEIVALASKLCGVSISTITLIDEDRQWFKAKVGISHTEDPRTISFCAHCILNEDLLEVHDASKDPRFHNNPLVTDGPKIRFYAGAPLYSTNGLPVGSLCVIDQEPRELDELQRQALLTLAKQVSSELELRLSNKLLHDRKKEVERLNASLQQLFRVIAHDLRSPFQGFLGITQLVEDCYDDIPKKELLEYMELLGDSASDTYNLLENLLEWSTIEVGNIHFRPKAHNLKNLIKESISVLSTSARKKKVSFQIKVPDDNLQVMADHKMISSVIRNLTVNAVKFSPENRCVTIDVQILGDLAQISISDQGHGMTAEQLECILNRKNVESSLGTDGERGSGIGLHLVHNFLEQHDTGLKVKTSKGAGTIVCFSLPLVVN